MIFNGVDIGIGKIGAVNNDEIEIYSKDLEKRIYFSYKRKFLDLDSIKVNETVDLIEYIYLDTSFSYKDSSLLFYIGDKTINLTKLNDKEFRLYVNMDIKDEDIIYFYEKSIKFELKTLVIDCKFNFKNK